MTSLIESNDYYVEAEALSKTWPVRRMVLDMPDDLRTSLFYDDSVLKSASFMNRANARFRQLATSDEQGLLASIGGAGRALRLALIDLGMGVWDEYDVDGPRTTALIDWSHIKLVRRFAGLYETEGHADTRYSRSIEHIYPGHECHADWGTGWSYDDNFGGQLMFDTKRDAVAHMWENMGELPGEYHSENR